MKACFLGFDSKKRIFLSIVYYFSICSRVSHIFQYYQLRRRRIKMSMKLVLPCCPHFYQSIWIQPSFLRIYLQTCSEDGMVLCFRELGGIEWHPKNSHVHKRVLRLICSCQLRIMRLNRAACLPTWSSASVVPSVWTARGARLAIVARSRLVCSLKMISKKDFVEIGPVASYRICAVHWITSCFFGRTELRSVSFVLTVKFLLNSLASEKWSLIEHSNLNSNIYFEEK